MKIGLNFFSFAIAFLVITVETQAQEEFTIQGMKVGMAEEEILKIAEALKSSQGIRRDERIFKTPQGKEIDETLHTASVSWSSEGGGYTVWLTRKPMQPKAHRISRSVSYGGQITERPELEMYKEAVLEKYGEPINVEEYLGNNGGMITYIFSESGLSPNCPSNDNKYRLKNLSVIKDCPAILKVEISFLNQPHYPLRRAKFNMHDHYLEAKDNLGFQDYWNQWMEDYLTSQKSTAEKPDL